MVLKVMPCTPSAKNPLDYNVNKVEKGDATIVGVRNMPSAEYGDICRTLLYRESQAINTQKPSIHIMISADKNEGESLADMQALELIEMEMNAVDMGNQPYVVFRHEDTDKTHYHIVSTKVLPDGRSVQWNGIGKRLVHELMQHEIEYGYVAGRNLHEVKLRRGEGVYQTIHDKFEKLLEGGNYYSYKDFRAYARASHLDIRKRKSKFVDRNILIVNRLGDDGKKNGRPVYLTGNEAERMTEVISNNYKSIKSIYDQEFIPMTKGNVSLLTIKKNAYELMREAKDTGLTVSNDAAAKFKELNTIWNEFNGLNQERKEAKDAKGKISAMIGMLTLLNPLIALTVMLLAKVSHDIQQSAVDERKKQLLNKVELIRAELLQLEKRKEQWKSEKHKIMQEDLNTKQYFNEYQEGLKAIDLNVDVIKADIKKSNRMRRIREYVQSKKAEALLDYINSAYGTFECHEHLVPGPLVQTDTGMRWELYSDGFTDNKTIDNPHPPAPVPYGKCYIDFRFNDQGELIATVEADKNNYHTKGISGTLNINSGEGEVKERKYWGSKKDYDRKRVLGSKGGTTATRSERPVNRINKSLKK